VTTVIFAGGGTGGHLMPALALAEEMVRLDASITPLFVGGERGVEAQVLPQRPWRYELLPFEPLRRVEWWKNARLPINLFRSVRRIGHILSHERPGLVIGTGGYVSFPTVRAAVSRRVPAVIQEQNAFPGLATRFLARHAAQVHLGFPEARAYLKPGRHTEVVVSGNPIKAPPNPRPNREEAKRLLGFAPERPLALIMGGSQGALAINRAVREAQADGSWPRHVQILWQTGAGTHGAFLPYAVPGRVRVEPFIDPIEAAYAAADLVVARAGAMTIAEVAAWALPSVLIPLPTSAAGHQLANARAMAQAGAAVLLEQAEATGKRLGSVATGLISDPAKMADMSSRASERALPNSASEIATAALRLVRTA
jgi:UDP-N-acetylglucosamine--N-acetylmuramyl-(pentapeptide) pyrophosphoryl-undecaprenol N-acetylglucosamine transferase